MQDFNSPQEKNPPKLPRRAVKRSSKKTEVLPQQEQKQHSQAGLCAGTHGTRTREENEESRRRRGGPETLPEQMSCGGKPRHM